jgi:hypothetical protein
MQIETLWSKKYKMRTKYFFKYKECYYTLFLEYSNNIEGYMQIYN